MKTFKLLLMTAVLALTACENEDDFKADISCTEATSEHIGWLIAENGCIYQSADKIGDWAGEAVAMIVYVGEPGTVDASLPEAKRLAIALGNHYCQWGNLETANHHFYSTWADGAETDAMKDLNGAGNTKSQAFSGGSAALNAKTLKNRWVGGYDWLLPSAGQWYKVLNGTWGLTWTKWGWCTQGADGFTRINNMFKAAGVSDSMLSEDIIYWTSTEYDDGEAVTVQFNSEHGVDIWHYYKTTYSLKMTNGRKRMGFRAFYAFQQLKMCTIIEVPTIQTNAPAHIFRVGAF